MSNPYCVVAIKFEEDFRGSQDVENAIDAYDTPAEVRDIKALLQAAEGMLQHYYDRHKNLPAKALAEALREYTTERDEEN